MKHDHVASDGKKMWNVYKCDKCGKIVEGATVHFSRRKK